MSEGEHEPLEQKYDPHGNFRKVPPIQMAGSLCDQRSVGLWRTYLLYTGKT